VPATRGGAPATHSFAVRVSSADGELMMLDAPADSSGFVVAGLRAGTEYTFSVAAVNVAGRGEWSAPAGASTLPATAAPDAPDAPTPQPHAGCAEVRLRLPPLRAGCAADASLDLEMARAGAEPLAWARVLPSQLGGAEVAVSVGTGGMRSHTAYVFRLRAINALGSGPAGRPSLPQVPGVSANEMRSAPAVRALSSTSYRVDWGESIGGCGAGVRWSVQLNRNGQSRRAWTTLLPDTQQSSLLVALRCPEGCSFRMLPTTVDGWPGPSLASEPLPTKLLHALARGAARVEIWLRRDAPVPDPLALQAGAAAELAAALGVPESRVRCVEVRAPAAEGATLVDAEKVGRLATLTTLVIDLLPTSRTSISEAGAGGWGLPDEGSIALATELARLLRHGGAAEGSILARADQAAGVQRLGQDGSSVRVTSDGEAAIVWLLAQLPFGALILLLAGCARYGRGCLRRCCHAAAGGLWASATRRLALRGDASEAAPLALLYKEEGDQPRRVAPHPRVAPEMLALELTDAEGGVLIARPRGRAYSASPHEEDWYVAGHLGATVPSHGGRPPTPALGRVVL
jgi:hypothetical protein